jgi:hypothetical protein
MSTYRVKVLDKQECFLEVAGPQLGPEMMTGLSVVELAPYAGLLSVWSTGLASAKEHQLQT